MLQRAGVLEPRELHEALREQERTGHNRSLGTILVERGYVATADVARCVEEQCVVVVARVIAAQRGTFRYSPNVAAPGRAAVTPLNADRILLDAMRRVDELEKLRTLLTARFAPLAPSARIDVWVATLNETEDRIVAALRAGPGSLAEFLDLLPIDEATTLRALISTWKRGLLGGGHGAPGGDVGVPTSPPPSEDDLIALLQGLPDAKPAGEPVPFTIDELEPILSRA